MITTRRALIIYGPTATGKTDLALNLAKKFNGELISTDSRQVYKGLDIGTGKVSFGSKVEKHQGFWVVNGIKIHGFDLVNPDEQFTAADFLKSAVTSVIQITEEKKLPIMVGGSGFYIKTLINGLGSIGIPADQKLRRKLEKLSTEELFEKLKSVNLQKAESLNASDSKNSRRLIRAIEIALSNQKLNIKNQNENLKLMYSQGLKSKIENYLLVGLIAPNQYLYGRADKWLKIRIEKGLIDEVKRLINQQVDQKWLDDLGLEYRWLTRYLMGQISKEEAIERLRGDIHGFIRRQKTWFRQFPDLPAGRQVHLFDISTKNWRRQLENQVTLWHV